MNVLDVDNDDLLKRLCEEYPSVIRLLKIMGVDLDDIEDLASDIFIDAYRNIGKLKDVDKLEAWLHTITGNRARKYYRQRMKRNEISNLVKTEMGEVDIFESVVDETTVEKILQEAERGQGYDKQPERYRAQDPEDEVLGRLSPFGNSRDPEYQHQYGKEHLQKKPEKT